MNGVLIMKVFLLLGACLISASVQAWDCEYEKKIEQELSLSGSEELTVKAAAGDLEVTGVKGGSTASIRGRLCVSEEEWLDESGVEASGGKTAEITVELPDTDGGWSLISQRYAYLDLVLEVPDDLPLNIHDSSGDIEIEGVGEVAVKDSSGDTEITDVKNSVVVNDSSGDIVIRDVGGDVTIDSDSSGDIRGEDIEGAVLVRSDSSGDIRFNDVGGDFVVERDSSGDIVVNTVGGDFLVERDGSGEIHASNVKGSVSTPGG
jgi:DUF4097 and DUF4098 domain-containing protein YvlB